MDQTIARAVARDCAGRMHESVRVASLNRSDLPVTTLSQALVIGAFVVQALAPFFDASKHQNYLEQVKRLTRLSELGQMSPEQLEEVLYQQLIHESETPETLREGIDTCVQTLTSLPFQKQFVHTAVEEVYGSREPGKAGKIEYEQLPQLASIAESLLGPAELFLSVHAIFPKTNAQGIVMMIAGEHGDQAAVLAQYIAALDRGLQELEFISLKTEKSKASYLADVMAGARWQLSPTYARQKAEEARRNEKRLRRAEEKSEYSS